MSQDSVSPIALLPTRRDVVGHIRSGLTLRTGNPLNRLLFAGILAAIGLASAASLDIQGISHELLINPKGSYRLLFFISHECPISNYYSPEIRRICNEYAARGVECGLVYASAVISDEQARQHRSSFGHGSYPAFVDRDGSLAKAAGATVTPEAALIGTGGTVLYRGRIDDTYAKLGKRRAQASQRDLRRALEELVAGKAVSAPRVPAVGCIFRG